MPSHPVFRHAGVVVARAATGPVDIGFPDAEWFPGTGIDHHAARAWLVRLWARPEVRAALRCASPALADQVDRLLPASTPDARSVRRTVLAVASYLLRWQGRATPFGLFAGVTSARIDDTATAIFGAASRAVLRADGLWVGALVDELERHPGLLPRLRVVVNSAGFTRGGRFVVPARVPDSAQGVGQPADVSIRLSVPVAAVLAAATEPICGADLAEHVHGQFPAAGRQKIAAMLAALVTHGVLLTCLRPPAAVTDPVVYLVGELRAAGGSELPGIAEVVAALDEIIALSRCHNTSVGLAEGESMRAEIAGRLRDLHPSTAPVFAVDVALDADISIPRLVLREAERAATVMLRLTAQPFGPTYWKDFQYRFRSTYGPGALVRVRDLIADSGLGFPASYLDAPRGRPAYTVSPRDQTIMALIQQAAIDGRTEIELTEPLIQDLTVGDPGEVVPPSRVEIGFELDAATAEDIRGGRFRLWVTAAPRPESSMIGRFVHLLSEHDQQQIAWTYGTPAGGAVPAQLSFAPRRRDNENITRAPRLLPQLIAIAEFPASSGMISVDDLAVTADATQLYLVQLSTGARILPRVVNALEATLRTPPLARFLSEIASARHAIFGAFDYGAARDLPHLPRIRYGRTILAPARWMLTAADLLPRTSSMTDWQAALARWRTRWRVPSAIMLCQGELRLPLDLDHAFHQTLLRHRLDRAGMVEIREAAGDPAREWAGRPCEFLVPMTAQHSARPALPLAPVLATPCPPQLPGRAPVLHAQILGNPARFGDILTGYLPDLMQSLHQPPWWYRRHRDTTRPDTDEELSLYLRLAGPDDYGHVAALLNRWAASLQTAGLLAHLSLQPYQFQPGRWGTNSHAAIQVFTTDSAAAAAEIGMATMTGIPAQVLAAVSMADLASSLGPDPSAGLHALVAHFKQDTGKLDPDLRSRALDLATTGALGKLPAGEAVAAAWQTRTTAIAAWYRSLDDRRTAGSVLPSLLHEHHARVTGVDPDAERVTNRLLRIIALRQLALTERDP
jgi:lantibiotic biosynthesis protein